MRAMNRLFFQYSGTLNNADAVTWLGNMITALGTFLGARISTDVTLVLSELTDLSGPSAPQVQNSTGHSGGLAVATVSAGVAMVLKKHISRRYRGGHPRIYLLGLPVSYLANTTTWDSTALGNVVGSFITFINACTANTNPAAIGTITHVNVSYFQGFTNHTYPSGRVKAIPTPRATPVVDTIDNITGNATVASQRRRNEQP